MSNTKKRSLAIVLGAIGAACAVTVGIIGVANAGAGEYHAADVAAAWGGSDGNSDQQSYASQQAAAQERLESQLANPSIVAEIDKEADEMDASASALPTADPNAAVDNCDRSNEVYYGDINPPMSSAQFNQTSAWEGLIDGRCFDLVVGSGGELGPNDGVLVEFGNPKKDLQPPFVEGVGAFTIMSVTDGIATLIDAEGRIYHYDLRTETFTDTPSSTPTTPSATPAGSPTPVAPTATPSPDPAPGASPAATAPAKPLRWVAPARLTSRVHERIATMVKVSGGTTPLDFNATGLPKGLTITWTGLIVGTPAAASHGTATIKVTEPNGRSTKFPLPYQISGSLPAPTIWRVGGPVKKGFHFGSANGAYRFAYQSDGNLVLYHGKKVVWSSHTNHKESTSLVIGSNGRIVLYNGHHVIWSQATVKGAKYVTIQNNGRVVIATAHSTKVWIK